MQISDFARQQVNLFTSIYPVFEQALPQIRQFHQDPPTGLALYNDVINIRHSFRAIPLALPHVDLERNLDDARVGLFDEALDSLLRLLETLVADSVQVVQKETGDESKDPEREHDADSDQQILSLKYPKLTAVSGILQCATKGAMPVTSSVTAPVTVPNELIHELATQVNFFGHGERQKRTLRDIATRVRTFKLTVEDIFSDPVETLERNLGNATKLSNDEIGFVRRAHQLSSKSRELFTLLTSNTGCTQAHDARLHLSGFLNDDLSFEFFVADQETQRWNHTSFKWKHKRPSGLDNLHCGFCARLANTDCTDVVHMAFNDETVWNDCTTDMVSEPLSIAETLRPLRSILLPPFDDSSDLGIGQDEFESEDQKIVEFQLACCLLHLDASSWFRAGLNIDSVVILSTCAQDQRWKPHIACDSTTAELGGIDDNDAILSFGLLLMEMEAKRPALPKEEDRDWETNQPSRDSMLKRILVEWKRAVEDGYKNVATACLYFQELCDRTHDPDLSHDMRRTAAIYRYILVPLYRLITQQYLNTIDIFEGFPKPRKASPVASHAASQQIVDQNLVLFDGSDSHSDSQVKYASAFMRNIKRFSGMIEGLPYTYPIPDLAPWRSERIRIAIIDTGIDDDDSFIEGAREDGRIKGCCGFISGPDSPPDPTDYRDVQGHGTHVARLLLEIAPVAELYIAKVSDCASIRPTDLHRISRAIRWAHEDMKVHIISMSFGLESSNRDKDIDKAIQAAYKDNVAMFAAAANSGGNKPRAYPSNRKSGVICIHASDGNGNDGGISPTPEPKKHNFSTLGMGIESRRKGKPTLMSGTSFATPIAVALAANVLEFARHACDLDEEEQQNLHHVDGVGEILKLMASERDSYDYIMPFHLWTQGRRSEEIAEKIINIVRG